MEDHIRSFKEQVERTAAFEPVHIVSHSARDCMSDAEQDHFFDSALCIEEQHGVMIAHETHRHRAMFTPWTTARLLRKFPELKISVTGRTCVIRCWEIWRSILLLPSGIPIIFTVGLVTPRNRRVRIRARRMDMGAGMLRVFKAWPGMPLVRIA